MGDAGSGCDYRRIVERLQKETGFEPEFCHELLEQFCDHAQVLVASLGQLVQSGNLNEAKDALHQLKGSSGNVRATTVYEHSRSAERMAVEGDLGGVKREIAFIEDQLRQLEHSKRGVNRNG